MPGLQRLGRYGLVGVSTFFFDMILLVSAVSLGAPYYLAVGGAFLIAVTVNYAISRDFVFKGTERGWHGGLFYFLVLSVSGVILTTSLVVFLVEAYGVHYLIARTIVGALVGFVFYWVNLRFNFRVAGRHFD